MDEDEWFDDTVDIGFEEYCEGADNDLYNDEEDYL